MASSRNSRKAAASAAIMVGGSVLVTTPLAADEPSVDELEQERLLEARDNAVREFQRLGADVDPAGYVAERLATGAIVVHPTGQSVISGEDGEIGLNYMGSLDAGPGIYPEHGAGTSVEPAYWFPIPWSEGGGGCLRVEHLGARHDSCAQIHRLLNDTDHNKVFYAFEAWGTAGPDPDSPDPGLLVAAALRGRETSGRAKWYEWAPRADYEGNCRQQELVIGVNAGAAAGGYIELSHVTEQCDKWDMTKHESTTDGLQLVYTPPNPFGTDRDRELTEMFNVSREEGDGWNFEHWILVKGAT